ncbi:class I SAM-dependent methyltransferase [Candidatus Latescibacterota bacterium]
MIGKELTHDTSLSKIERVYIRFFGAPINGLRIRARRILPLIPEGCTNILDSGCGQGVFTFEVARRFPDSEVTGMDMNGDLIERNRRIAGRIGLTNCRFEEGDITEILGKKGYDLILSIDVLEHVEDDDRVLNSYMRALGDNSELLLHVPGYYRRWPVFGWKENFEVEGHYRHGYTMEDITAKVTGAGFEITDSYYTYGWIETMSNNLSYAITGAQMKRKYLYALAFPFLLGFSYFGKDSRPSRGAGILIRAKKRDSDDTV